MSTILMVIANVISKQSLEVALVHGNNVIEQIPSAASHPALGNPIVPGTLERGCNRSDLHGLNRRRNLSPYFPSRSKMRNFTVD